MPFPLLAALAAAPSIYKGIAGLFQSNKKVEERPYVPPAFSESLDRTRLAAGTNRVPGAAAEENRILQGTAAVGAGALRASASSSDVLAALGASDAQQKQAFEALGARGEASRQQQQGVLRQQESQFAAYQQQGRQATEREQGALTESGQRNIFGALDGLSQVAAYGLNRGGGAGASADLFGGSGSNYIDAPGPQYRRRRSAFGLDTPVWAG